MIEITMTEQESIQLKKLLKEMRGEISIRKFCSNCNIHYSAWRSWESLESVPTLENLKKIADLKGWTLEEITSYLKTGEINSTPYSVNDLLKYAQTLSFEEKVELARKLLESGK